MDDVARRNRAVWAGWAPEYREAGRRNWDEPEPRWGIWDVPERQLGVLGDVTGQDVLELGCGTAYWSSWLARRGTRVVGLDNSLDQLTSARELQRERGPVFPLVQADGARVPLRDATFDVVFNEYRAGLWVDPERWFCDYFAPARLEQLDGSIEFHLPHGEWIRLLRRHGFVVEDLIEVQPPAGATTSYPIVTPEWARPWPCEEIWKAVKR